MSNIACGNPGEGLDGVMILLLDFPHTRYEYHFPSTQTRSNQDRLVGCGDLSLASKISQTARVRSFEYSLYTLL